MKISKRINFIFKKFYAVEAKGHARQLCHYLNMFIESTVNELVDRYGDKLGESYIMVNESKVILLIDGFYLDVIRYKEYHYSPDIDDISSEEWMEAIHDKNHLSDAKLSCYLCKWILKNPPISFHLDPNVEQNLYDDVARRLGYLNEAFCVNYILGEIFSSEKNSEHLIDAYINRSILYHLRYRTFEEKSLFLLFDMLSHLMKKINQVANNES